MKSDEELNLNLEELHLNDKVLTTIDNPYNPKEQYDLWRQWDIDHHYNTEEYLARVINLPSDVDLDDTLTLDKLTQEAIYKILEHDDLEIYRLV